MKLPIRFRVRTLMAIVALVALGLGVPFELNHHAKCRRIQRTAWSYWEAATQMRWALECQRAEDRKLPYRPAERLKRLASDGCYWSGNAVPIHGFDSWQEEFDHHRYWGERLYEQVQANEDRRSEALGARPLPP